MTEREFITELYKTKTAFANEDMAEDLAHAVESLSSDIFTEYIRFLFELIQNADDAEAGDVWINLQPGHIVVAHNGKAFTDQDVKALCSIGRGTKRADQTKTGYKGIGFKSVFGKSKHVAVFSQGFQFKFTNEYRHPRYPDARMPWQIIPVWAERKDYPADVFVLPSSVDWNVVTVIAMSSTEQLQQDLMELIGNGEVLLFLRHLKTIRVQGPKEMTIARTVNAGSEAYKEVTIRKNGKVISEWITHTFEHIPIDPEVREVLAQDDKTPKKLQEATEAEISFAAKVNKGKITRLSPEESLIFTYLPTKVRKFGFPFLLNGSFLTNAGREELHEDRKWNEWLMEQAGEKIIDWLALLAETKVYSDQILLLLPSGRPVGGNLEGHFHAAFEQRAGKLAFIPARNGNLLKARETLVDVAGLSDEAFISPEAVVAYFNSTHGTSLDVGAFIRTSVREPNRLERLHAHFFKLDDFEVFVTGEVFRANHSPEQNYELIRYLHDKARNSREWTHRLQSIPFIYAVGEKLRTPGALCFPSMEYTNEFGEGVTLLHKAVYTAVENDLEVREWLKEMGMKEPSEEAYLENEIIGNIGNCITEANYKKVTRFLFEKSRKGELSSQHYRTLHGLKLKTTRGVLVISQNCFLSDDYEPRLKLEKVHGSGKYVCVEYIQPGDLISDWKSFFLRIGVAEKLSVVDLSGNEHTTANLVPYAYFAQANAVDNASRRAYPHLFRGGNRIDFSKISFSEHATKHEFAMLFWEQVFRYITPTSVVRHATLHWGYYGSIELVQNYIPWSFKHEAIFPTTTGECLLASQVFVNHPEIIEIGGDSLPVFSCEEVMKEDWLKLIPLRTKLELEDYLKVLGQLANQAIAEDGFRRKSDRKRIGLIYAKLSKELKTYSPEKLEELRDWAKKTRLLATDGEFALPSELKWVKETGARVPKGRIRLLMVPDNCPTDEGFEDLLRDLGVEVIDAFKVKAEDERRDTAFMDRIKALVPFLALVASVRQTEDLNVALERIEDRRKKLKLLQCSELSLVFTSAGEELPGDPMQCHRKGNTIRYKGKWDGKSTIYELVPELAKALDVPRLDMDLMRLLQSDLGDIEAFMIELGGDVKELAANVLNAAVMVLAPEDEDPDEENIPVSSKNHLAQDARNEANREARDAVLARLRELGFSTDGVDAQHSVVDGVTKDGIAYPLVIKSYRNTNFKFNIRPNEWAQLDKENAMFWVYRGNGNLVVLRLEDLLEANKEFHVQFETATFGREGMAKFAGVFRYVRNVHFQLDAPDFKMADALEEYRFNARSNEALDAGNDSEDLLH
ncbi:MAG: ATP-binding protein [Acidobacteria bacterium]|nr:ATP-binding protein [Acidobacteriota bacterium]